MMLERGVELSHQTVKNWSDKFADSFVKQLRKIRRKPSSRWYMDEIHTKINGKKHYIWRAVDEYGVVLDIYVSKRRTKAAAKEFFSRVLAKSPRPTKITTERLNVYKSVICELAPRAKHRRGKWLNNRCENSHTLVRPRERALKKFKSRKHAQTFLGRFEVIRGFMKPKYSLGSSAKRRSFRYRNRVWRNVAVSIAM